MTPQSSSINEALTFIKQHPLGAIATVSPEGQPRVACVYISADENMDLYFMTKMNTAKYAHIERNPRVGIVIADEDGYQTVQAEGVAEDVQSTDKQIWMIEQLAHNAAVHPTWQLPINQMQGEGYAFLKISPTWLRWAKFRQEDNQHIFEQIIPEEQK